VGSRIGALKAAATRVGVSFEVYSALVDSGLKWCHGCQDWHLLDDFGNDANRTSGVAARCLPSRRVPARENSPGIAERRTQGALGLAWCRGCKAWLPVSKVTDQGACRPCTNAEDRQRYAANPEPYRARTNARKRGLEPIPTWWAYDRLERFGGLCAYGCGRPADTWDHIWPVSRGGLSTPGNLVPADRSCNSRKKAKDPAPWIDKGAAAFPMEWLDIADLAIQHNTDEWLEGAAI
jgi:5-methylcytosine-specific restriction endonuclease McrA